MKERIKAHRGLKETVAAATECADGVLYDVVAKARTVVPKMALEYVDGFTDTHDR